MKQFYHLGLFLAIIAMLIFMFIFLNRQGLTNTVQEGMTGSSKSSGTSGTSGTSENGIAGNAAGYAASLKSNVIKTQDELLISKYRTDYETAIINLDDFINNQMLTAALSVNTSKPQDTIQQLAQMYQAKNALNSVMKYIDSQ